MNFRQLAYGLLSYVPGIPESLYKGTGGTLSADYCYCIWLRHLVLAHSAGMNRFPSVVAELGPGDSIGTGLAALLSGASRYIALDAMAHANTERNLQVFDRLVTLFQQQTAIPDAKQFPEIKLNLSDYRFPTAILDDQRMQQALSAERIAYLRRVVSGEQPAPHIIDYRAPWNNPTGSDLGSIDFILSNAVMEHVTDLTDTYATMYQWLHPGGYASHQIDFRSHGLFRAWDGHWTCPDWLWCLFMGRRSYLLNREPLITHRTLANAAGFHELSCIRVNALPISTKLAPRFDSISAADRSTEGGYLLHQKALLNAT